METILANVVGKSRRAKMHGRDYLVAPATIIVPGVLPGSKGRLYYPPDEVAKDPWAWNGVPLVGYHPTINGVHVSGRDPTVLDKQGLGWFFKAVANGKLSGETWFDIENVRRFDETLASNLRILPRLEKNQPIELSTGLYTDNEQSPGTCPRTGKPYDAIARNYRPDHLAILPDQRGACSLEDGCGVLVNELPPTDQLKNGDAFEAVWNGTELAWRYVGNAEPVKRDKSGKFSKSGEAKDEETDEEKKKKEPTITQEQFAATGGGESYAAGSKTVDNAGVYGNPQSTASGKFKRHGSGTGKGDVHEAAQRGGVMLNDDDLTKGRDAKAQADAGSNPASWVEDEATWDRAKEAASKGERYETGSDSYWSVVTHIYKAMGGGVKEATSNEGLVYEEECECGGTCEECKAKVDNANPEGCNQHTGPGCSGGGAGDKTTADKIVEKIGETGEAAVKLAAAPAIAAAKGLKEFGKMYAENMGILIADTSISKAIVRGHAQNMEDVGKVFNGIFSRVTLGTGPLAVGAIKLGIKAAPHAFKLLTAGMRGVGKAAGWLMKGNDRLSPASNSLHTVNADGKVEHDVDETELASAFDKFDELNKLLESDPDEAEAFFKVLKEMNPSASTTTNQGEDMDRTQTINWLTTNCDCWKGQGDAGVLNNLPTAKLVELKAGAEKDIVNRSVVNAVAQHVPTGMTVNAMPAFIKEKMVAKEEEEAPVLTPEELAAKKAEEEKMAALPTTANVANRLTAEEREDIEFARRAKHDRKVAVVTRLVANVSDPTKRQALGTKYMSKPLAELSEMLELLPTANSTPIQSQPLPNFSGASAPMGGLTDNEMSDVLDLEGERVKIEAEMARNKRSRDDREAM